MLTCDYFPLTENPTRGDFYAMAFYSKASGKGFLNVVSNNRNLRSTFAARLDMLEPEARFTLTHAESGETATVTGTQLAQGFCVTLPQRSGCVWFLQRN